MKFRFWFFFLLPSFVFASGTVVRDGGDPILYFLEATRYSLVETIKLIQNDKMEADQFCKSANLNPSQVEFCREFFKQIANQVLSLNQGAQKTLFVLRSSPLEVEGPDGKMMPVAARTARDSKGEVEFHRDSIKLMAPARTLHLMAHEFQHKSKYQGRYTGDNEVVGPFRNGRELIDTVANAIAEVAKRRGKVGTQYLLRDSFECISSVGEAKLGMRASSPRFFLDQDLTKYETSLSRNPSDALIYVPESLDSDLVFRVVIAEPANCSPLAEHASLRKTQLQVVRVYKRNGKSQRPEEILSESIMTGYNPMCIEGGGSASLSYQNVRFDCRHYGTEGLASSYSLRNQPIKIFR
jgi:hypothetical protein